CSGAVTVNPLIISSARLELFGRHLLLFFTGISRYASEIAALQIENIPRKTSELTALMEITGQAADILSGNSDLMEFGKLFNENWKLKKSLSERISSPEIDSIYETAMQNGAAGGKLLGAGGGGFMLFFTDPSRHDQIKKSLKRLLHIPFSFDFSGSEIAVYQPDKIP
ncbi:MAG TPA: kinase, partial [Spirochaetia bacterium]|nr:kinase [Spirochaetia bacterium]